MFCNPILELVAGPVRTCDYSRRPGGPHEEWGMGCVGGVAYVCSVMYTFSGITGYVYN